MQAFSRAHGARVVLVSLLISMFCPVSLLAGDGRDAPKPEVLVSGVEANTSRFLKTFLLASKTEFYGGFANQSAKAFTGVMEDVFLGGVDRTRTAALALYEPVGRAIAIGYVPVVNAKAFMDSMTKNGLVFEAQKNGVYKLQEKLGDKLKFLGYVKFLGEKQDYATIAATEEELAEITTVPTLVKGSDQELVRIAWMPSSEVSGEVGRQARKIVDSLPRYEGETASLFRQRKGLARKLVGVLQEVYLDSAGFEMVVEPVQSETPDVPGLWYHGQLNLVPGSELASTVEKFSKIPDVFAGLSADGAVGIANATYPLTPTQADMLETEAEYVHALLKDSFKKSKFSLGAIKAGGKPVDVKIEKDTRELLNFENDLSRAVVIDASHAESFSGAIVTRNHTHVAGTRVMEADAIRDLIATYVDSGLIKARAEDAQAAGVDLFEVAISKQLVDALPDVYAGVPKLIVAIEPLKEGARLWYATGEKASEELLKSIAQARAPKAAPRAPIFVDYSLSPLATFVNRQFGFGGPFEVEAADRKLLDRLVTTLQKSPHNNVQFWLEPKANALGFQMKMGSGVVKAVSAATISTLTSVGF